MNKSFLLLRSNKETGPFSITELHNLSLTANDLVWVQGQSTGWRYPVEIDELKEVLVVDKQPSQITIRKKEEASPDSLKKEQGTSAKKIFVRLPVDTKKPPPAVVSSFEEKAEAVRQKALNFSEEKEKVTEVNYTRSLSDIKEEYSGWIQDQKRQQKHKVTKPFALTLLFVGIIATLFFLLQWNPIKGKSGQTFTIAAKETVPVVNEQTNNSAAYTEVQKKPENSAIQFSNQNISEKIVAKTVTKPQPIEPPSAVPPKLQQRPSTPMQKEPVIQQKEPDVPISDLMETTSQYIQSSEGIGLSIALRNKSGKSIRVAAIDVIYFDKAKMQTSKETLYFSNVQPGSTMTKTSSYVKAASASYHVGLVSAESAGLYVMQ